MYNLINMKLIRLVSNDPHINLSSEYYFLTSNSFANEDMVLLWKNKNTIVIGKNQCLYSEVDQVLAMTNNTKIVRRISGGGAVYHDDGNICFTFIKRNQKKSFNFKSSLLDIVDFLNSVNIDATFSGRNDIIFDNKKISGNAVYFYKNDYMIHGTLLFDVDIEKMMNLLTVDKSKLTSKGIESVKSRVINIKEIFHEDITDFENKIINFFEKKYQENFELWDLTNNKDVIEINNNIFKNYDWIYGRNLEFNFSNKIKTETSLVSVKLKIENNIIADIELYSDSLMSLDLKDIHKYFLNKQYNIETITEIGNEIDLNLIAENFNINNLIELFFKNK